MIADTLAYSRDFEAEDVEVGALCSRIKNTKQATYTRSITKKRKEFSAKAIMVQFHFQSKRIILVRFQLDVPLK